MPKRSCVFIIIHTLRCLKKKMLFIDSANVSLHDMPIPGQDVGLAEFS